MTEARVTIDQLSLEDRIAQLLMPRPASAEEMEAILEEIPVGGFIVHRAVARVPADLARAVALAQARSRVPLFISADQEGGNNQFMGEGATEVPSNMALAATAESGAAEEAARILAEELAHVGVNWDLAPVVDVNVNPENPVIGVRSYSDDPATVGAFGAAAIRGYQASGLLACAKHFPGHGDTNLDSHVALPVIPHDRERLDAVELAPFREAIAVGVASIMTAHIRVPALDPERVATLSAPILTGLLREELGYDGIVVTDAMDMAGVASEWDATEAAVETIAAGADVILTARGREPLRRCRDALVHAARSGRLREARLGEALRRIGAAKRRLLTNADPDRAAREVGSAERRERALALARRTITLLRDEADLLPLRADLGAKLVVVGPIGMKRTMMEQWHAGPCRLGAELARFMPGLVDIQVEYPLAAQERAALLRAASRAEVVVVGTLNAVLDPEQVSLVKDLADGSGARVLVVALRMPYDVERMPWLPTFVAAYTSARPSLAAVAEALAGKIPLTGRLPVRVSARYPRGYSASREQAGAGRPGG